MIGTISGSAAMKSRLSREFTLKSLVSDSAVQARVGLQKFASYPRPRYSRWRAMLYGSFIDWAIFMRLPLGDNVFGFIVKRGGPEQVRLLLALARFDEDGDGCINFEEFVEMVTGEQGKGETVRRACQIGTALADTGLDARLRLCVSPHDTMLHICKHAF